MPSSHNGQDVFIFELRFSEAPKPGFSYTAVREHAFTRDRGSVTYVRRLEPGKNARWEITITPGSGADVDIALNATTDCSVQGAICTIARVGVYYFQCRVNSWMVVLHLKAHLAFFLSVS